LNHEYSDHKKELLPSIIRTGPFSTKRINRK